MRRRTPAWLPAAVLAVAAAATVVWAKPKGVVLPQDTGPDKVDVSSYPPEMQASYKIFTRICSKCHTLARPINTSMTASYWAHYVGIMVDKSPDPISVEDAKKIYEFLVFDQEARKDKRPGDFFPPLTEEEIHELKVKQGVPETPLPKKKPG